MADGYTFRYEQKFAPKPVPKKMKKAKYRNPAKDPSDPLVMAQKAAKKKKRRAKRKPDLSDMFDPKSAHMRKYAKK